MWELNCCVLQGDVERKLSQMILDKKFHGKSYKFTLTGGIYKGLSKLSCLVIIVAYTIWPKVCGLLTIMHVCGSSPNCCHEVEANDCIKFLRML